MSKKKTTPMLQQFYQLKSKHPNDIVFFRLGDFYEMFGDDAVKAAGILGLTLTSRHKGSENEIAMCGVPHHSSAKYISQLVAHGLRVAVCEQVSDPSQPGIVQREVAQVITPSTIMLDGAVDDRQACLLVSVFSDKKQWYVTTADMRHSGLHWAKYKNQQEFLDALLCLKPQEIIYNERDMSVFQILTEFFPDVSIQSLAPVSKNSVSELIKKQFNTDSWLSIGLENPDDGLQQSLALLLCYLLETQKKPLLHLQKIMPLHRSDSLHLSSVTLQHLELLSSSKGRSKDATLSDVMNICATKMGSRSFYRTLVEPSRNQQFLESRFDTIEELLSVPDTCQQLLDILKKLPDIDRLVAKLGSLNFQARDAFALRQCLEVQAELRNILSSLSAQYITDISQNIIVPQDCLDLCRKVLSASDEQQVLGAGNVINSGYNQQLDELKNLLNNGENWLMNYQEELKSQTGISTLKIKYNKVFHYTIEVSKSQASKMPKEFELKQTLVNASRFTSVKLKEFEANYLSAKGSIAELEQSLFSQFISDLQQYIATFTQLSQSLAQLDLILSFALLARDKRWVRPRISDDKILSIQGGKHPVIEHLLQQNSQHYTPNDCFLDANNTFSLITGPNMGGKSSFLRQNALIVLMAQMGSFVPAEKAEIGLVDAIFTRVGAGDDLNSGQSTFMVEMSEAAFILRNATERSLVIVDELGRGTSTHDGLSLTWSIVEYLNSHLKCRTLMSTHFHELIDVVDQLPTANNVSVQVAEHNGKVVFLHQIKKGATARSYGIDVAGLAGVPREIISRSQEILKLLNHQEQNTLQQVLPLDMYQQSFRSVEVSSEDKKAQEVKESLEALDINSMTPLEALQHLSQLKNDL